MTVELSFKFMKRQLEQIVAAPAAVDEMTFMQVVRASAEDGLLDEVSRFFEYREARNITSHSYDKRKAELRTLGQLRDAFDDSNPPFSVDIIEWASCSDGFRRLIATHAQPFRRPTAVTSC